MIKKVKEDIKKYRMLEPGDSVVVAVSGGPDSIALLKVLETLSDEYRLTLITAHLNHGLREDADREAKFVCEISKEVGIKFECKKVDINFLRNGTGKSIEDISRDVRYQFLNNVAQRHNAHKIALGHHLNDQVETVLINFLRGSGPEGLKGMLPARDSMYIRPLLHASKKEILSFLDIHKIPFMSDKSNTEGIYLRNRIRHLLIPELTASYNPKLEESLSNMAEIMRVEDDFMKTLTDKIMSECGAKPDNNNEIRIKISELRKYHEAVQRRIIKNVLQRSTPNGQGIGYTHIKMVKDLAYRNHPSGHLNLPYHTLVKREYDFLVFSKVGKFDRDFMKERDQVFYKVTLPGSVKIAELGKTIIFDFAEPPVQTKSNKQDIVLMDYDRIILPLVIRTGKPGDRMQPLGMKGTKKIKSFFIDEKVPLNFRKDIPLLLDQESVLWIAGMRMSERVKITEKTTRILKAEIV
jgi:tRNA(Ile)-lysidine synthase